MSVAAADCARLLASHEADFFRAVNAIVEPALRDGTFAPVLAGTSGPVVVETLGRKSGLARCTPLIATRLAGGTLVVSTYRGARSEWVRNLAANHEASVGIRGCTTMMRATVLAPGRASPPLEDFAEDARMLVPALAAATELGWAFALLVPAPAA